MFSLLYITSTNRYFINFMGFDFNPSKLLLLLITPFIFFKIRRSSASHYEFLLSISIVILTLFKSISNGDFFYLTEATNFILPLIFYLYFSSNYKYINLKKAIKYILFFCFLHSLFGLYQFYKQDRSLVFFEEIQEYKITQVDKYFFNPFTNLELLPHGLYSYSSLFSISLIFPLFLLIGNKKIYKNQINYWVILFTLFVTIFCCFSRFEIVSAIIAIISSIFISSNKRLPLLNKTKIKFLSVSFFISITYVIIKTMESLGGGMGTMTSRMVFMEYFEIIFFSINHIFFGIDVKNFTQIYKLDITHNFYVFCLLKYGLFVGLLFMIYFLRKMLFYAKLLKENNNYYNRWIFYLILFYIYIFLLRSFSYYLIDGYENIFLIFYVITLIEISLKQKKLGNG